MCAALISMIILFFSCVSYGSNLMVYFGGGGEKGQDRVNLFLEEYEAAIGFRNLNPSWQTELFFSSTHVPPESKKMLEPYKEFTQKSYGKEIKELIRDIDNGKISKGSQLLIEIDTHGAPEQGHEFTHQVAMGQAYVSLDNLKELRDAAEAHGVKLAIVDDSCYSGNTLKLATEKTCVITATTADNFGYGETAAAFISNLTNHGNLEEAFLASRKESESPSQPQISTPEGLQVEALLRFLRNAKYANLGIPPGNDLTCSLTIKASDFQTLESAKRIYESWLADDFSVSSRKVSLETRRDCK